MKWTALSLGAMILANVVFPAPGSPITKIFRGRTAFAGSKPGATAAGEAKSASILIGLLHVEPTNLPASTTGYSQTCSALVELSVDVNKAKEGRFTS
ncbi:MAG: hypothetical protein ACR650_17895 [Methylocystis sp.]